METQLISCPPAELPAYMPSHSRSWMDQPLPAPLISYDQAEVVALGLLREQPQTRGLVGVSMAVVCETLDAAGISTSLLLLNGREKITPDLVLQTSPEEITRFDELHAQILCGPQPADVEGATWLRQRRLAHLRQLALGGEAARVFLPQLDAGWHTSPPALEQPSMLRWVLQATPLLLIGAVGMIVYIYNAGANPDLWPLFLLPLLGALGFGGLLFYRLSSYRHSVAQAWLARPARLRPDTHAVAHRLARRPWALLYVPVVLLLLAFVSLILLLAGSAFTTAAGMATPVVVALILLLGVTYTVGHRYLTHTRELIQLLPAPLLPVNLQDLWLAYLYY